MTQAIRNLRPDAKHRICLGKLAEGVSSFNVEHKPDGTIVLTPFAEIPAREKWLFENPTALASVREGLDQAAKGQTVSAGSFAQFIDDELE